MKNKKYVMVLCPQCGVRYIDWIILREESILLVVCPLCEHSINLTE